MKKTAFIFLLLLLAAGTGLSQDGQVLGKKHLDIIFVIDASGSMHFTDPDEFRKVAVKAFIDITQDRGGDRIAVLQFAGWNETSEKGAVIFPLTEIPSDEREREKLLGGIKNAVGQKVSAFGKGTDFNFAFEKAVAGVLEERKKTKTPNKAWVILLTDGTTDVKEGGNTRKEYLDAAGGEDQPSRKALNDAAQKYFAEKVLPQIAGRKNLFLTCISLTRDEPSPELKLLAQKAGATVLRTTREALRAVFIEALASLPKGAYRSDLTRGFGYDRKEAAPSAEVAAKFRVFQGTAVMRALIFAGTPDFTLDLKDPEKKSVSDPKRIRLSGAGELYRVITITGCPPGEYTLSAANTSMQPAVFETLFFAQFELTPGISVETPGKLHPGDEFSVHVSLGENGRFCTDRDFLGDLESSVKVKLPDGTTVEKKVTFSDSPQSKAVVKFTIPDNMKPGGATAEVSFRALKQTLSGEHAFAPPPATAKFTVVEKPVIVAEKPVEPEPEPPPVVEPEPEPEPEPPPVVEPEPEPPAPEPEPEPEPQPESQEEIETNPSRTGSTTPGWKKNVVEDSSREQADGFPLWLIGVVAVVALIVIVVLIIALKKPKGPALEFHDQQLWSAGGDARLLADLGEGGEVSGTPEIPNSIVFRLTGTPEAPKCQVKAGPEGRIYVDRKPVAGWVDLQHGAKIEVEAAGRPEAPVYKYTYFERDPSVHERDTATRTVKKAKRETSIKPEDIFPTDVLEKERAKRDLPPPPDGDEFVIYDDEQDKK